MEIKDGGILIIAGPRTGGTGLMNSIGKAYNKETRFEYDIVNKTNYYNPNKDVVKFVPLWHQHLTIPHGKFNESFYDWYDKILINCKEFKTIILLNRRDVQAQIDSYSIMIKNRLSNISSHTKWHPSELKTLDEIDVVKINNYIHSMVVVMKKLSEDLNLNIDYYEDVYKNKTLTNKTIKLDLEYFKPKYKLKQEIKSKRLV